MNDSDSICKSNKRLRSKQSPCSSSSAISRKKHRTDVSNSAVLYINPLEIPLVSSANDSPSESIRLEPFRPYTIGRRRRRCEFVFEDRRVSNRHCQVVYDSLSRRVCISDGLFFFGSNECSRVGVSLNGVFVNGARIGRGKVAELCAGDEVSLVCGNGGGGCSSGVRIGFVIQRIVIMEEVIGRDLDSGEQIDRLNLLLIRSREILAIRNAHRRFLSAGLQKPNFDGLDFRNKLQSPSDCLAVELNLGSTKAGQLGSATYPREAVGGLDKNSNPELLIGNADEKVTASLTSMKNENDLKSDGVQQGENRSKFVPPPGNKFYLNRLRSLDHGWPDSLDCHTVITLPELLYPVESITRIFMATFTSDISWFLSYCEVPTDLPVTIACHNTERCWSSSSDKKMSMPYSNFPNLVVVYPPFPESIAFGNDRKRLGIACHHPKLIIVQREDTIRVVITSANLNSKQWNDVTNTVWWQDFPRSSTPDYLSLFTPMFDGEINSDANSDFAAQLAGFVASLVIDVPSQAYWVSGLANYDFKGATGYLVASVPGVHSRRAPSLSESMQFSHGNLAELRSFGVSSIGSIEASVVGLSHLFRTSVDSNGTLLKKLAAFLRNCSLNTSGMSQIVLRRNTNIPVDVNAVSVLVPDPEISYDGDCIQLGFLPRNVAKWVAPLWDSGLFKFYGYIYPKEVRGIALEGSTNKVQLIIYVAEGPNFSNISDLVQPEHVSAICTLVASIQRCVGLWRLQEVLGRYKWPDNLETDFIYGASSIGSVNAQFLAAFSAAAGKKTLQLSDSEESDPEWGCWSASQELRNPSIRIIFPTIDRVKNASCGVMASKRLLCFSQKTWHRLQNIDILHDAIPHPYYRAGHPMHTKVGRRRFKSKSGTHSFGWVYSGSHNFSAAAWGRPLSKPLESEPYGSAAKVKSALGFRLHVCNYELGILFVVPPSNARNSTNLDDITLPFVVPAPKYRRGDRPATAKAMWQALAELSAEERENLRREEENVDDAEEILDDVDDEDVLETTDILQENEDEKAYADVLWSQVEST